MDLAYKNEGLKIRILSNLYSERAGGGKGATEKRVPRDVQEELEEYIVPGVEAFQGAGSQRLREISGNEK